MKLNKKIPGILIITGLLINTISAQNNNCYFSKSFPVKMGTSLKLSNKYGDVNVITVKNDSLQICATITVVQDDRNLQKKSTQLITVAIEKYGDTINIATQYDKRFFSETLREGRKSFSVDYLIKLPSYLNLSIANEYGNISLDEISGAINIRLSRGVITAKKLNRGNFKPVSTIYADHSKVDIDELKWMVLTSYNCPSVNIYKAQALVITSSFSKIRLGETGSMVCESKSDSYSLGTINNFLASGTYSTFGIGKLTGQLKIKEIYGSLEISAIENGFSKADIATSQTQIAINPGLSTSFTADIIATGSVVDFPANKYPGIIRTGSGMSTALLGSAGNDNTTKSLIVIRATGGTIKIL